MKYKKVYVRLITTYLVVFMIPLLMEIYSLEMISRSTRGNICQNVLANLNHTRDIMDDNLREIDNIVQNLSGNSTVRYIALLMDEKEKYIEISKLLSARDYMKTMRIQTIVDEYYLFFRNNNMVISSDHIFQDDDSAQYVFCYGGLKWEEWMEMMAENYTSHFFPEEMTKQNVTTENRILYVQSMVTGTGTKGNFVFPIKSEAVKGLMRDTYVSGPGWAYMMDGNGSVLLAVPSEQGEFEPIPQEYLQEGGAIQEVRMNGRKMEIIQTSSSITGLTYVAVLPEEYIMVQINQAQKRTFWMLLLVLILGLGSILAVSWYRGRKIDNILQMLFKVDGSEEDWKGDEMIYISQSLKQLIANNSDLQESIKRQEPITRGLMLERLLQGGSVDKELEEYGVHLTGCKIIVIAYQIEEGPAGKIKMDAGEVVVYKQLLLKGLKDIIGGEQYGCDVDVNAGAVICAMKREEDCRKERLVRSLEELCSEFWEKDGIRVRIAVGNICEDADKISKSYDQVYEMLQYGIGADKFVYFYEDYLEKKDYYYFPVPLEERLVNAVRSGNMDSMHEQLKEVYQVNVMERDISPSMMHFLVNDLQCTIFKALHSLNGHIEIDEEEVHAQLEQLIRESDILLRFNRINHIFRYICGTVQEETDEDNRHQKEAIEKYIRENYSNSDLSLTKIADDFNYASTYFSKLFKELFHENFVNYLERIRIEEVCRLLMEGMKLEDIASQTGYNSVYVMRTAFKRIKGTTPNDYRKAGHKGNKQTE